MKLSKLCIFTAVILFAAFAVSSHAKNTLSIATDDWPPYEYKQDGSIVGFSTEVVKAVLKQMNVSISSLRVYPWARAEKMAFNGDIDMIYSASKSDKRLEHCHFPDEPLIVSPNLIFIRKADVGRLKFDSFSDLKEYKVGIVREYAYTKEFLDYLKNKNVKTITVLDDTMNFKMLMKGIVDYIPADLGNSQGIIERMKLQGQVYAFRKNPIKTAGLYALFSKKNIEESFVVKFSEHLKEFKSTDAYIKLYNNYFNFD